MTSINQINLLYMYMTQKKNKMFLKHEKREHACKINRQTNSLIIHNQMNIFKDT